MKKLYFVLLTLLISACYSGLMAQEYDPADVAVLKAIRDNAPAMSPLKTEWANEAQVGTWAGVGWTGVAPRKVNNLNIPNKNLTSLSVSGLTSLFHLDCSNNQITNLTLSGCTNLQNLFTQSNLLTSIDLSGLTLLWVVQCNDNRLASLNASGYNNLHQLHCVNNRLTTLNLSGSVNLEVVYCMGNLLTSLDLTGLTQLIEFRCSSNQLVSLTLSGNNNLKILNCENNQLLSLNAAGLVGLQYLSCFNNRLTSLNVTGCTSLQTLLCYSNQMGSLDVSGCTMLFDFECYNNLLTSLNFTGCTNLYYLICYTNKLTSLDVSGLTNLFYLYCYNNQLQTINVSGCTNLYYFYCFSNKLSLLDVSGLSNLRYLSIYNNYIPFSKMPLRNPVYNNYTYSPQNKIFEEKSTAVGVEINYSSEAIINGSPTSFTWYKNDQVFATNTSSITPTEPGYYFCQMTNDQFPGLTLTTNTTTVGTPTVPEFNPENVAWLKTIRDNAPVGSPLKTEWADAVPVKQWPNITWTDTYPKKVTVLTLNLKGLQSLDVTGLSMLNNLSCGSNQLTSLKVTGLLNLSTLNCQSNLLSSLDLTGLPVLQNLNISYNNFASFDARGLSSLRYLYCYNNQLTSLNVTGLTGLYYLYCYNNQLTSLNVTGLTGLNYLYCYSNKLTNLDVTGLSSLRYLYCYFNFITALDVTGLTNLYYLICYNNNMQSLKVSGLANLRYLYCYNNKLSALNLTGLTNLYYLYCYSNQLTSLNVNGLTALRYLLFDTNKIPFSAMPLPNPVYYNYDNNPQNKIFEEKAICSGTVIDYSGEALIDGAATSFAWYKNGSLIPGTDQTGKYTATGDGAYHCIMTNPKFPGLTLTTNTVTIDKVAPVLISPPSLTTQCSITEVPPYANFAAFKAAGGSATDTGGTGVDEASFAYVGDSDNGQSCPKTITRTYKISDVCGNTITSTQAIVIDDTIPPVMTLNETTVYLTNEGKWTLNNSDKWNISKDISDNCTARKDLTVTFSPQSFDCTSVLKKNQVVVKATDKCNNTSTAIALVTVLDTIKPVAKCQDVSIWLDASGEAYLFQAQVNAISNTTNVPAWAKFWDGAKGGSYDNCGVTALHLSKQLFTCNDVGHPYVDTLYVVDTSGNTATCKSTITVLDTLVPVITQAANITMTVDPGTCSTKVAYPDILVKDNCTTTLVRTAGLGADSRFPLGTTTETWKASDAGLNSASMSFTVTISSYNAPPTIGTLPDMTIDEDAAKFEVPLTDIGYGIDCIAQQIASLEVVNSNPSLLTVTKEYTNGAATGKLIVTPLANKYGEATITLTVKDNGGTANGGVDTTVKTFKIVVNAVNDLPTVTPIADQVVIIPNSLSVNVVTPFKDVEDGTDLTFVVTKADGTALPSWMSFNATTGLLTGTPALSNYGAVDIKVVATDKAGGTGQDIFNVLVKGEFKIMGKVVRKTGTPDLITQGKDPVATPAAGVEVVLKQGGNVVVSTTTAADGTYSFNVPSGDYGVFVIVQGYTQNVTQNVTVNAANPVKDKVDFTIWTGTNSFVITTVKDPNNDFGFKLYPNPTTGKVNIELIRNALSGVELSVYNILGVEVYRSRFFGGNRITLDLSGNVTGIYLVKIEAEGQSVVKKITLDRQK